MVNQTTIKKPVYCYGTGVHSGKLVTIHLKPAQADTGITFIRTDTNPVAIMQANFKNVADTTLSTTIKNQNNVSVSTIEHLMAAIWGSNIDNLIVEIDGPEVPIMDGSSRPFVFMLQCAGKKSLNKKKQYIKVNKEISIVEKGAEVFISPAQNFIITMDIDFPSKVIGKQKFTFDSSTADFEGTIAGARTFGFVKDLQYLHERGLGKGASLENAIAIDDDKILNKEGLRFEDEFVRHKLLDAIGDYFTAGHNIIGNFHAIKAGHYINNRLLHKLFSVPGALSMVTYEEIEKKNL